MRPGKANLRSVGEADAAESGAFEHVRDLFQDSLLEGLGLPAFFLSEGGGIEAATEAAERMFGCPTNGLLGLSLGELLSEPDLTPFAPLFDPSFGAERLDLQFLPKRRPVTARRSDGSTFPAELTISRAARTGNRGYVALFGDVSPVHEVRKALSLNQERFALAMAGTNEGIWDWDVESGCVFVSDRVRELFSRDEDISQAEEWLNIVHPEDRARYQDALKAHLKGATPFFNVDYRLASDPARWVRHRGLGQRNALGRVFRMAGSVGDISQAKAAEAKLHQTLAQAESANKAKSDFLAAMSHELRTPLNAIIGFSEMIHGQLMGPIGTPKYGEYAGDIMASARHLLDIINDILEMARMDAGQAEFHPSPVDMSSVIDGSLRLLHQRISHSGLSTQIKCPPSLPPVLGDERRLKQVMINLIGNAIKFTPKGGSIAVEAKPVLDGRLMVRVVDSGIGIAERDIQRALAPFTQVDSVVARRYQGSGLGLPLAKAFVELHGGNLELSSILGKGTTVTLYLPIHAH